MLGERVFELIREAMKELEVKELTINSTGYSWRDINLFGNRTRSFGLKSRIGEKITKEFEKEIVRKEDPIKKVCGCLVRIKGTQKIGTIVSVGVAEEKMYYSVRSEGQVIANMTEDELESL